MIYLNGTPLTITHFPDNTSQVWNLELPKEAHIYWDYKSEAEFLYLAQLKDLLDYYSIPAKLHLPYLPYGRQDKPISNSNTFALKTFAKLLNSLNFDEIVTYDAHSSVAFSLINNLRDAYSGAHLFFAHKLKDITFVYPDKGAAKRYSTIRPSIKFDKKRNEKGKIIEHVLEEGEANGKKVLIVDDICDGGATFISVCKLLKDAGAIEVNLYVSHGIFSKGLRILHAAGINRIFTRRGEAFENNLGIYYKEME